MSVVIVAYTALGGLQAVIGKIMVASGQVDAPQVSHYKLTAHLSAAFLVFALMFWRAQSLLYGFPGGRPHPWYPRTIALTVLIAVTIVVSLQTVGIALMVAMLVTRLAARR